MNLIKDLKVGSVVCGGFGFSFIACFEPTSFPSEEETSTMGEMDSGTMGLTTTSDSSTSITSTSSASVGSTGDPSTTTDSSSSHTTMGTSSIGSSESEEDSGTTSGETSGEDDAGDTGTECLMGLIECKGECIDSQQHPFFCGAQGDCIGSNAGMSCSVEQICEEGQCVAAKGWTTPQVLHSNFPYDIKEMELAVGRDGMVVATWHQSNGSNDDVWSSVDDLGDNQWSAPERLNTGLMGDATNARVVSDPSNFSTVVWRQSSGGVADLWSSRRSPNDGTWTSPQRVEERGDGNASSSQSMVVDGQGRVVLSWIHQLHDSIHQDLWTTVVNPVEGTWSNPFRAELSDEIAYGTESAVHQKSGEVTMVWHQRLDPIGKDIVSATLNKDSMSWGPSEGVALIGEEGYDLLNPKLCVDAVGTVTVLWYQNRDLGSVAESSIWWSRRDPQTQQWSPEALLDGPEHRGRSPEVYCTRQGNVMAVWNRYPKSDDRSQLTYAYYDASTQEWSTPGLVGPDQVGYAFKRGVVADADGIFTLAWGKGRSADVEGVGDILVTRFDPKQKTWTEPRTLSVGTDDQDGFQAIGVDDGGNVIVLYRHRKGGVYRGYAVRYQQRR